MEPNQTQVSEQPATMEPPQETMLGTWPPPHFMGYARLEGWADVSDPAQPVYATRMMTLRNQYANGGPENHDLCVLVAQIDADGYVHYWRMRAATVTMMGGTVFDNQATIKTQAQAEVWQFVKDWLRERGYQTHEACVAFPRELRYFEGTAEFIAWNPTEKRYHRYDKQTL